MLKIFSSMPKAHRIVFTLLAAAALFSLFMAAVLTIRYKAKEVRRQGADISMTITKPGTLPGFHFTEPPSLSS